MENKNKTKLVPFHKSIRFKLIGSTIIASLLLNILLVSALIFEFNRRIEREYVFRGEASARMAARALDGETLDRYLYTLEKDEYYFRILEQLRIMQAENEITYLSVVKISDEGQTFIFDADELNPAPESAAVPLGTLITWEELYENVQEYEEYIQMLLGGVDVSSDTIQYIEYGYLLSIMEPILRADGSVAGYVCVDMPMTDILNERSAAVLVFGGIGLVLFILTVLTGWIVSLRVVVKPIKLIVNKTETFLIETDEEMTTAPISSSEPELHSGDELSVLENSILKLEQRVVEGVKSMHLASKRIKAMYHAIPLGCNMWSSDMELIDCNDVTLKMFKFSTKQEYFDNFINTLPEHQPDGKRSAETARNLVKRAFKGEFIVTEWLHVLLSGEALPVEITLTRIKGDDEQSAVVVYIRDLREYKRMMMEIKRRDDFLFASTRAATALLAVKSDKTFEESLLEGMEIIGRSAEADCVELWQNEGLNTEKPYAVSKYYWKRGDGIANFAADNILDYNETDNWLERFSKGEIISGIISNMPKKDRDYLTGSGIKTMLAIPLTMGEQLWGVCCIDNYTREHYYSEAEIDLLRTATVMIMGAISRHETTVKMLESVEKEHEALAQKQEAEAVSEFKSRFLANMSHEIRTPMNAVLGMTELILNDELSKKQRKQISDIKVSATALLDLINDILDISKIQAGKLTLNLSHYNLSETIDNINSMVWLLARNKGLGYEYNAEGKMPRCLYGDNTRLRQILLNVLGNAVKYTDDGGVSLLVKADGERLKFIVSDTGIGIKPEDREILFDSFSQVEEKTNQGKSGTGLGLAITRSLVELMGGEITLESDYGKGSTFTISIPIIPGDPAQLTKTAKTLSLKAPDAKVLVVDDNAININVANGFLGLCLILPDTAMSGWQAINMVGEKAYDIIFMDHMMPDMDGVEATKIMRDMGIKIPIIALTANAIAGIKETYLEAGMNDLLTKPIDKERFFKILTDWLPPEKVIIENDPDENKKPPAPVNETPASKAFWDRIYSIENLDADAGLRYGSGQRETYETSIKLMIAEINKCLTGFDKVMKTEDIAYIKNLAHSLKGSLSSIGAGALSDYASRLDRAARADDLKTCKEIIPEFVSQLANLRDGFEEAFALKNREREAFNIPLRLYVIFDELKKAFQESDFEAIYEGIEELDALDLNAEAERELSQIKSVLKMMDYEIAEQMMDSFLSKGGN